MALPPSTPIPLHRRVCTAAVLLMATAIAALLHALLSPARADVKPDRTVDVYRSDEQVAMLIDLPPTSAPTREVTWQVADWQGVVEQTGTAALPAGPLVKAALALKPLPPGWYEIAYKIDGKPAGTRTFVTGTSYKSHGEGFRYGICAHMLRNEGEDAAKMAEMMRALGIDIQRMEIPWAGVQRGPDAPFTFEKQDAILRTLQKLGIEPAVLLDYGVPWATTAPPDAPPHDKWRYAPQMEPWLAYVRACVQRYGKSVRYWEIWNEPDIGFWKSPTAAYLDLFSKTSAEIARLDPGAQILNGGFAMVSREPNRDFLPRFMEKADRTNWHLLAYHDYMTVAENRERFGMVRDQMKKFGDQLPLWINEGGFHTLMHGGERAQAVMLVKKMALSAIQGVKAYFWYNIRDDGLDPRETEHHFGLTRHDFQPKPAFAAYRELIRQTADRAVLIGRPGADDDIWVASYGPRKRDKETAGSVHVVWRERPGPDEPMWLSSNNIDDALEFVDIMGRPIAGPVVRGRGLAMVGSTPIYVRCAKGSALEVRRILQMPERVVVTPTHPASAISLRLTSPFNTATELTAALRWKAGDGNETEIAPELRIPLPAGETKALDFIPDADRLSELIRAGNVQSAGSGKIILRFTSPQSSSEAPATVITTSVTIAMEVPQVIGKKDTPWRVELLNRTNLRNLHEGEPNPAMHWAGPDDLSAVLAISAETPDTLHLVATVRDNVHRQDFESAALWKGDSLQLVIAPTNKADDYLEITLGLNKKGTPEGWINRAPSQGPLKAGPLPVATPDKPNGIRFRIERNTADSVTTYEITLPSHLARLSGAPFLLNALLNDDDGGGRKQWMHYTPGIGESKNPRLFRTFVIPPASPVTESTTPSTATP
ncbi:hypothetical protein DB346_20860 [Verrucomicrobia bacterium LW23]|nr:hypothetical protein DB346_20860 [Verrucomicrobia bacterium LW23]